MIDPSLHVVAQSIAYDLTAHFWSKYDQHHENAHTKLYKLALLMGYKLVPLERLDQPEERAE